MLVRIAINGLGRVGRSALKIALESPEVEVVAINDLTDVKSLAYLLNYDTVYGEYEKLVSSEIDGEKNFLLIDNRRIPVFAEKDPMALPWGDMNVDVVLECTGVFTEFEKARVHLQAGAKKVIISAPGKGEGPTVISGTASSESELSVDVISNGSCTTNCVSPVVQILEDKFGIERSWLTTIHSYTADQSLVDGAHPKDLRRGRAAAANIIPTTTGAAQSVTAAVPSLQGRFEGTAIRVPTICVSLSIVTALLRQKTSVEELNQILLDSVSEPRYKGILATTVEPLVSSDFIKSPFSSIVSLDLTSVMEGDFVTIFAWYDNEWGYANRLVEMSIKVGGARRE